MSKRIQKNIFVVVSYILITVFCMFVFIRSKHCLLMADSSFQLSRANEIYQNLKQGGFFTFIASHCFSQSGVGTFLFYPSVFIYPLALLRLVFNPITSIWIWVGLFLFLTLIISFYSMLTYSKGNYKRSYLFALIYTVVPYHLYLVWNGTFGEFIAYTFLPLIFLGIYYILWLNSDNYFVLALGMSLVCYSHVLSLYISVGICLLLFILKIIFSSIKKEQFVNLVKAFLLTVVLTLWQFIPFLTDYCGRKIIAPREEFQFPYSLSDLVINSLTNVVNVNGRTSVGIFLVLTMLIGWALPQLQHNKQELMIYLLGTFIILCSTTYLAWQIWGTNGFILHVIGKLQMMFRLLPYGILFLSVTFSFIIDNGLSRLFSNRETYLLMGIFTLIIVGGYYGSIQNEVQILDHPSTQQVLNTVHSTEKPVIALNKVVSAKTYGNIFAYRILYGETDYYNKPAFTHQTSIINNWTYINGKKYSFQKKPGVNKITMIISTNQNSWVNLPIVDYHNTYVMNNGKNISHQMSQRGTVEIFLKKGHNVIQVGYKPTFIYYGLLVVSLFTWIGLLINIFKKRI